MVTLTEQVDIPASFERLCLWADNFEEEFVKWSPYHIECQLFDGGIKPGNRVRFREIVMGMDYNVTGTITSAERSADHFKFSFLSDPKMAVITFEGVRTETGCRFIHTEAFGIQTPVIGPIINFLIFKLFYRKKANWQIIRDDMILDNRYLTEILTMEQYPARVPIESLKRNGK